MIRSCAFLLSAINFTKAKDVMNDMGVMNNPELIYNMDEKY
jgi:hypothetical protein